LGYIVLDQSFQSGRDLVLFGVPMIVVLAVGIFRLDELLARKHKPTSNPPTKPVHRPGAGHLNCEPDGKPLNKER